MATDATILVVDDDESIRVLMMTLLRQRGFTPLTACSGEEALEQVTAEGPGLILLDLGLQDIGGEEFMARLRLKNERIPVVIVSGKFVSEQDVVRLGAVDALMKPFEISHLVESIERCLEPTGC